MDLQKNLLYEKSFYMLCNYQIANASISFIENFFPLIKIFW